MKRLQSLSFYQKTMLFLMLSMIIIFTALYSISAKRIGYLYYDEILVPTQQEENTTYTGKLHGIDVSFQVSPDKTVIFQEGDTIHPPYTYREDETAIPSTAEQYTDRTGIEISQEEHILFRGILLDTSPVKYLMDENGNLQALGVSMSVTGIVDLEPNIEHIVALMTEPPLTQKTQWSCWPIGCDVLCPE